MFVRPITGRGLRNRRGKKKLFDTFFSPFSGSPIETSRGLSATVSRRLSRAEDVGVVFADRNSVVAPVSLIAGAGRVDGAEQPFLEFRLTTCFSFDPQYPSGPHIYTESCGQGTPLADSTDRNFVGSGSAFPSVVGLISHAFKEKPFGCHPEKCIAERQKTHCRSAAKSIRGSYLRGVR
jgi:hypothetical protein